MAEGVLARGRGRADRARQSAGRRLAWACGKTNSWGGSLDWPACPLDLSSRSTHCLSARRMATVELETRDPGRTLAAQVVAAPQRPGRYLGCRRRPPRHQWNPASSKRCARRFVSDVSHELRTSGSPSIRCFALPSPTGTAADDVETRPAAASVIRPGSRRMERLLNDLLDLSRMESAPAAGRGADRRPTFARERHRQAWSAGTGQEDHRGAQPALESAGRPRRP